MEGLIDYSVYNMSKKEKIIYIAMAAIALFLVGYVFYRSIILSLLITPFALFYPRMKTKQIIIKRRTELNIQFKDMLYSLSSSITAGKSVEVAFADVLKDLRVIYPDENAYIIIEAECIIRRLSTNETIEEALRDMALRTQIEDIENFVDIFHTCKRSGGNIVEIIRNTSNIISDKIEIKQEIDTMLAERKFEQRVLNVFPIGIIVLLSLSAPDYMAPVFETLQGRVAMSISIVMFVVSYFVSKKIMEIDV